MAMRAQVAEKRAARKRALEAAEEEQQARRQKRAELMSTKLHAAGKEVAEDGFRLDISVF